MLIKPNIRIPVRCSSSWPNDWMSECVSDFKSKQWIKSQRVTNEANAVVVCFFFLAMLVRKWLWGFTFSRFYSHLFSVFFFRNGASAKLPKLVEHHSKWLLSYRKLQWCLLTSLPWIRVKTLMIKFLTGTDVCLVPFSGEKLIRLLTR